MYKRLLLTLAGLPLLAGCGSGSNASLNVGYSGSTSQAVVASSNAKALSADAYSGAQLSSAVSGVGKAVVDSGAQPDLLQQTAGILEQSVLAAAGASKSTAKVAAAVVQNTVSGYSGSYTYSVSNNLASGASSGTLSFSQYRATNTSAILSGVIDFAGTYVFATLYPDSGGGPLPCTLSINMNNLTATNGGRSFTLTGSLAYNVSSFYPDLNKTVTMSVVITDTNTGRTYWAKDITYTLTGSSLTVTGSYYDPIHGYVVISTTTPLTVTNVDAAPLSGQLLFTGKNGTKARLTFTGGGNIVEVDAAGNGTYVVVP